MLESYWARMRWAYAGLGRMAAISLLAALLVGAAGCEGPSTGILGVAADNDALLDSTCAPPLVAEEWVARVIELVNDERALQGLSPLSATAILTNIAEDYACEMIEGSFFDHISPVTGSTVGSRALQYGYMFRKVGENLAGGQESPEQVLSEWMDSPGHRANILDADYTEMGAAVRLGGEFGIYWVQEFGLPR